MIDLKKIERRKARRAERREILRALLDVLLYKASDPARIGQRVIMLDFALRQPDEARGKTKELAARLGVTEAAISQHAANAGEALDRLENLTSIEGDPQPVKLSS